MIDTHMEETLSVPTEALGIGEFSKSACQIHSQPQRHARGKTRFLADTQVISSDNDLVIQVTKIWDILFCSKC